MPDSKRYLPARSFPSYAYLPGQGVHPNNHPEGHSYGVEAEALYLRAPDWRENDDYLYGVDLYNHGYLWEAHEAWEGLWHRARHDALQAMFLQGLIQCAAAALKVSMGQPRGLERLAQAGTGRLEQVLRSGAAQYMGLEVASFVAEFRAFAASEPQSAEDRPRLELDT